jgi:hypothetical protein
MDTSKEEARYYLEQIHEILSHTKKKIAAGSTAPLLIIWGGIWFVAYLVAYLCHLLDFNKIYTLRLTDRISVGTDIAGLTWTVLVPIGIAASWIVGVRKSPTRSPHNKRWGLCFLIIFVYGGLWLALLWPWNEYQANAFVASLPMFAYVIMGLWADRVLLWLGIVVTLLIIVGFFLLHLQPLFWLWMAVLGGGTLGGTGLYIRVRWS